MCRACEPGFRALMRTGLSRRDMARSAAAFVGLAVAGEATAAPPSGPADVIFQGGTVLTQDSRWPRVSALAVRGDRILAVGSAAHVAAHCGPKTRTIDLAGRTLAPGFVEPHMHGSSVFFDDWLDLSPFTTATVGEALDKVRAEAARAPDGAWIRGQGFDPALQPGGPITLDRLDAAAPDHPLIIVEGNGHVAYANRRALALAKVDETTPDPPQGRIIRDAGGRLTGRFEEPPAMGLLLKILPQMGLAEYRRRLRRLLDKAASVGCTSLHDCGVGSIYQGAELDALAAVMKDDPPVRYSAALVSNQMDQWLKRGLTPGVGDDLFRVTAMKLFSDGSNQARSGYQREPYLGGDRRGALNYSGAEIEAVMARAHGLGWQVSVHANGDAAIDTVLAAYAAVLARAPRADHRHRIEHCSILHPEQMAEMRRLGVSPSFLIGHVHYWGRAFRDQILGPARADLYDPCASALKAGLRISLHSDYSVTPMEPLRYMENAVTRVMKDGGEVLNPAERITPDQALRAVTLDAAWQCQADHVVGSLEVGKYADLVLLEGDPTRVDPTAIRRIKVSETWMGGRRRYAA